LESISQCKELIFECEQCLVTTTKPNVCDNNDVKLDFAAAIRNFYAATRKYNSIAIDITWLSSGAASLIQRTKRSTEKNCLLHILLDRITNLTNNIDDSNISAILAPLSQNLTSLLEENENQWDI
jgi:hypothetical protein